MIGKINIYEILEKLDINYEMVEHKVVMTSEEAEFIKKLIKGEGVKNLFLKDGKNYYLILIPDDKKANIKNIKKLLKVNNLYFASSTDLENVLGVTPGSVTPLGIINDTDNKVLIIIDEFLIDKVLLMHPLTNTKTISIKYSDLVKYINYFNHKYRIENVVNDK